MQDSSGQIHIVADPMKEGETVVGCDICNMGLDEGKGIDCPGFDMFDV